MGRMISVDVSDFNFKAMSKRYQQDMNKTVKDIVKDASANIEMLSKNNCPVLTGLLRESIHSEKVSETETSIEYKIGTTVEYAEYVEYGTYKQKAQPFLRPAFNRVEKQINRLLK